jgi:GNAT superfamily N-acetyltransferase
VGLVLSLVRELAEIEGLSDEVKATETGLKKSFFGANSIAEAFLILLGREVIGYFVFCPKVETYSGKNAIYLDHLYIRPDYRRMGIGKAVMAYMAKVALEREATWVEWVAVESNHNALKFYAGIGGKRKDFIKALRLEGDALKRLAKDGSLPL